MSETRWKDGRTAADLVRTLRARGVQIRIHDGRIQVSAPAGVVDVELQGAIRQHRDELLELLRMEGAAHAGAPPRLSPAQERLWLFQQLEPDAFTYNLNLVIRIGGPLDVPRLDRALCTVLERHEPLRSLVGTADPAGVLEVQEVPDHVLNVIDLADVPPAAQATAVRNAIQRDQQRPFDLAREIPFRATLIRLGTEHYELSSTIHHIAADGISMQRYCRDLAALYAGRELAPLRTTYRKFAEWQRAFWTPERTEDRIAFWKERLRDAPTVLDFPADYRRSARQTFAGGAVTHSITGAGYQNVRALARGEGASLFMVMLAVFSAALHRHSGQRDMVIGTPLHGRDRSELGELIGMFVNQLPLRMQMDRGSSLRKLIGVARDVTLGGMAENEIPFGTLVEALRLPRDPSRNPLFQAMLNVLPPLDLSEDLIGGGITFEVPGMQDFLAVFDGQSRFDLTLYVVQKENSMELALNYNANLFGEDRMASLLRTVSEILEFGVTSPDMPLDSYWLDNAGLPASSVAGPDPDGPEESVTERFTRIARAHPDRPAVIGADFEVTYAELHEESARVAGLVADNGATPDSAVGVFVPHDPSLVPAIVGVLMSGRPYVPLDPSYPEDRLTFMAEDSGARLILTTPALRSRAEAIASPGTRVVTITDVRGSDPPVAVPGPESTAYLLYTSGSTGRPKAVVQTQGNLVRQADRYARALDITSEDRIALLASISFDASLMDLFGALLTGAAICPIDPRETDLSRLPDIVREEGINILHFTPTVFRSLAKIASAADWSSVRAVVLGGEPVRPDHLEYFDRLFPAGAKLLNLYGASEHSFSIGEFVDRSHRSLEVPVGHPLGDVEIRLIDSEGQEDPVRGEMVIRSAGNALGYRTADPSSPPVFARDDEDPSRSRYRTGDLARRRTDGRYVVLGRVDAQVKVRGHRVEPAEVEAVLHGHPDVLDVGVHAPAGADGERALTACYIPVEGAKTDYLTLAAWCAERLPRYLVPTEWVAVDRLPRTPSGKVDRRALPAADPLLSRGDGGEARYAEEQELQQIWSEVLGRPNIGVDRNFFEIGGHSLTATQVVSRIRDVMGVDLPLRVFFDQPTIAQLSQWLRASREIGSALPPLSARSNGSSSELSFSQERLWFLQKMDPQGTAYNMEGAVLLQGDLDVDRLRRAFETVAMSQESLRTHFHDDQGRPFPVVSPTPTHVFSFEDLSSLSAEAGLEKAHALASRLMSAPYILEQGPLFRILVVRLSSQSHLLAIGMHHTISDMWSLGVLGRALRVAYASGTVDPPPVSYRDYAAWQRAWLRDQELQRQIDYWRARLANLASLDVPTDFPRPAFVSFEGDRIEVEVPENLRERLQRFSAGNRATPFMTSLAAFNVLLAAYTRSEDIPVGVPIAGRRATETHDLIGAFVNTLVHRNDLSGDPSFRELIQRVRSTALEAYGHQDAPFELLVKELRPPRDTSRAPFFQVLFNMANVQVETEGPGDTKQVYFPIQRKGSQFDFAINVALYEAVSNVQLTYNTALFTRQTAERLLWHYLEILERCIAEPDLPLSQLRRTAALDRQQLAEWNRTEVEYPEHSTLHGLIEAQVERTPDAVAVSYGESRLSYRELDDRANRLAYALRQKGVVAETPVGVFMERSLEMVVSMLGILKAGGAYVPLDPEYPSARLEAMLEDAGVPVILTQARMRGSLPDGGAAQVLSVDAQWEEIGTYPANPVVSGATRTSAAYVIFTSGSTGRPKGVVNTHAGICNRLLWMQEAFGLDAEDVVLQKTPFSFDVSVWEFFWPLMTGARLVMAEPGGHRDPGYLIETIAAERVTTIHFVPSMLQAFLEAEVEGCDSLKRIICSGEALPVTTAKETMRRLPGSGLHNLYGPTEAAVDVTWWPCEGTEETSVPIGRPIANTRIHILDAYGNETPIGVPGELHIGGVQVARGYINRPELTAEKFVADPFAAGDARLYRTGDLAYWRPDGAVEFLGRLDHQVKIRGLRIELGEIETVLEELEEVRQAVVMARGEAEDRRLVAYVVFTEGRELLAAEIRKSLGGKLPQYMVPGIVVPLEAFPLTPSGKVDRKALPDPLFSELLTASREYEAPVGEIEEALAGVWTEVLEVERVGRHDNFFELGGHSLRIPQVASRLRERFGPLNIIIFFEHPTLAGLAEVIANGEDAGTALAAVDEHADRQRAARMRMRRARGNG